MDSGVHQDAFLAFNHFTVKAEPLDALSHEQEMRELEIRVQESIQQILHPMHSLASQTNGIINKIEQEEESGSNVAKEDVWGLEMTKTEAGVEEDSATKNEGIIIYSACFQCKRIFPNKERLRDHSKSCRSSDLRTEFLMKLEHGTTHNYNSDENEDSNHHHQWSSSSPDNSLSNSSKSELSNSGNSTTGARSQHVKEVGNNIKKRVQQQPQPPKKFSCQQCEKSFARPYKLTAHMRTHTGERPFPCPYEDCGKRFGTKAVLKNHLLTHTGLKSYNCNYCKKSFRDKPSQLEHERNHTLELPFVCSLCDRGFSRNRNLKRHVSEIHSKDNQIIPTIPCDQCNKLFRTQECLRKHRRVHLTPPVKPFKCNICNKSFVLAVYLDQHLTSHATTEGFQEVEENFACDICNKTFQQQTELNLHLTESHGNSLQSKSSSSSTTTIISSPEPIIIIKEEILS